MNHEDRVKQYFDMHPPKINYSVLRAALYTLSELGLWPDNIDSMSPEHALFVWGVVEKVRASGFPNNLGM